MKKSERMGVAGLPARARHGLVILTLALPLVLAACGGGGDEAPPPPPQPALTFNPSPVTASVPQANTVTALQVTATSSRTYQQMVYVMVIDPVGVINPYGVTITPLSATVYQAQLTTVAGLSLGHHTGQFEVRVCYDSGCQSQVPGSPSYLPYDINVN